MFGPHWRKMHSSPSGTSITAMTEHFSFTSFQFFTLLARSLSEVYPYRHQHSASSSVLLPQPFASSSGSTWFSPCRWYNPGFNALKSSVCSAAKLRKPCMVIDLSRIPLFPELDDYITV